MYDSKYFLQINNREIDVTHVMHSKLNTEEVLWWLIQIGKSYDATKMLLVCKRYLPNSPLVHSSFIMRKFELRSEGKLVSHDKPKAS